MPASLGKVSPALLVSALLSLLMILLTALGSPVFENLSLYPQKVAAGEVWRIFTANFVHFGWPHTFMNVAALVLCCYAFFDKCKVAQILGLLIPCCIGVGMGIYFFNPNYSPYAGLSGTVHGLIAAGLILNTRYNIYLRCAAGVLLAGKLFSEVGDPLQAFKLTNAVTPNLLDVPIAVEAHLYGALAGLVLALVIRGSRTFTAAVEPRR